MSPFQGLIKISATNPGFTPWAEIMSAFQALINYSSLLLVSGSLLKPLLFLASSRS